MAALILAGCVPACLIEPAGLVAAAAVLTGVAATGAEVGIWRIPRPKRRAGDRHDGTAIIVPASSANTPGTPTPSSSATARINEEARAFADCAGAPSHPFIAAINLFALNASIEAAREMTGAPEGSKLATAQDAHAMALAVAKASDDIFRAGGAVR